MRLPRFQRMQKSPSPASVTFSIRESGIIAGCNKRLATIAEHHDLRPRSDDLCIVDETCAAKTGQTFEKLDRVHDGRDGQIKNGYHLLGFLIVNRERGIRYVLDILPLTTKTNSFRSIWRSWIQLIGRNRAYMKGNIFVDAGFRNQYLLRFLRNEGKHYVIRVLASMVLETSEGRVNSDFSPETYSPEISAREQAWRDEL